MRMITGLKRLAVDQGAAVAVVTAIMLTGLVGLTGAGVDLGVLYAARNELQNAADAAALAGAANLVGVGAENEAIAQPDVAESTASQYVGLHKAGGVTLSLRAEDLTMGVWDSATDDFDPDRTGPSADPDDLTALRVTVRRDTMANTPVSTYFAKILGIDDVNVVATSTGFLGYAGSAESGDVDLPIAVHADALTGGGDSPLCGSVLEFANENDENGEWTTFFTWPANDPTVRNFVDGSLPIPGMEVGDVLNVNNGNLSTNTFNALIARFNVEQSGGEWTIMLPVVESGGSQTQSTIVGFVHMTITEVNGPPDKNLIGHLSCDMVAGGSRTGGDNFGTRATAPTLVQ